MWRAAWEIFHEYVFIENKTYPPHAMKYDQQGTKFISVFYNIKLNIKIILHFDYCYY